MSQVQEVRLGVELRAAQESGKRYIEGRLVPYNTPTIVAGAFTESIAPRCFAKSIKESARRLPLMLQHRHEDLPIGSAVEWADSDEGLDGRWELASTAQARDAYNLMAEGHLNSLSVGFSPIKSDWVFNDPPALDEVIRREARLLEASVVSVGAYPEAGLTLVRTGEQRVKGTPKYDAWKKYLDALKG